MRAEGLSILVLVLHFASTFYMVGLVWFVQRVHYPLFAGVGSQQFPAYERAHVTRTNPVVGPAMLMEAATALALVVLPMPKVPHLLPWLGVGLLAVIWLSTSLLQVPRHRDLSAGFETSAHRPRRHELDPHVRMVAARPARALDGLKRVGWSLDVKYRRVSSDRCRAGASSCTTSTTRRTASASRRTKRSRSARVHVATPTSHSGREDRGARAGLLRRSADGPLRYSRITRSRARRPAFPSNPSFRETS
jgi:hypothetical protein